MEKFIVWSDMVSDVFQLASEIYKSGEASSADDAYYVAIDELACQLDEVREAASSLDYEGKIVIIGDLGLWNGRRIGYKILSHNLADVFESDCDNNCWYVDKDGDLRCTASHHDGTNYYRYRVIKPSFDEYETEGFLDSIYTGNVTEDEIEYYTEAIGKDVVKMLTGVEEVA